MLTRNRRAGEGGNRTALPAFRSRVSLLRLGACALLLASFGCNGATATSGAPTAGSPGFDGQAAYKLLVKQCDFGPRPVGSEAHRKTRDFLLAEMGKYADKTVAQDFSYRGMPLTNVIGVFNPDAPRSILLCAHWDTRPTADMEIDADKRRKPIIGANDGASGVAVLLEMARQFKARKPRVGVVMVLLDGEDYGDFNKDQGVFLGSRYFADHHESYHPDYGILLDMVGDKDLDIYREVNSQTIAPGVNQQVFSMARRLGYGKYLIDQVKTDVVDDHIALTQGGIRTIDLIDFNYGPWHTLDDTPDKCSPESLAMVGSTVSALIYSETAR